MDEIQICTIFLFQFKLGQKAAETAHDINDGFGPGTTNERVAQQWFKKFCNGDRSLKDEDSRAWPTAVNNKHLKALIEAFFYYHSIHAAPIYPTFLTSLFALNGKRLLSGRS